jgi:signal transduction histidine kinase
MRNAVFVLLLALSLLSLTSLNAADSSPSPRRVLLLSSFDPNMPVVIEATTAIVSALTAADSSRIEVYRETLDADRFDKPLDTDTFETYFQTRYASRQLDAVITLGVPALRFSVQRGARLWPSVPVVFGGVTQKELSLLRLPERYSGFTTDYEQLQTVRNALALLPSTKTLAIVSGCAPRNVEMFRENLETIKAANLGVEIVEVSCLTTPEYKDALGSLPPNSIILWTHLNRDRTGVQMLPLEFAREIFPSVRAPIFTIWSSHIKIGAVGGRALDAASIGREMGYELLRMLDGKSKSTTRITSGGQWMYNYRQLLKHGVSERVLPAGSLVINKNLSVWEQYRFLILGTALFLALQSVLIVSLLVQRRLRARAQERLRELSGSLINAQEEIRGSIARELHDDVNQRLGLLSLSVDQLQSSPTASELNSRLTELSGKLRGLSTDVHRMAHHLHPSKLEFLGLTPAIRDICREVATHHGIGIDVDASEDFESVPHDATVCVYRVVQEALQNIVRHSGASSVRVSLSNAERHLKVCISDNGRGFDPGSLSSGKGLGFEGMKERLRLVQGSLQVQSSPGAGVRLLLSIPVES